MNTTPHYRICSLYSGSSGNSVYIGDKDFGILIDAGKNAKALCSALSDADLYPEAIKAIFITHEHNDHISALPVFLKKHKIPVHITSGSASKLLSNLTPEAAECVKVHPPLFSEEVGNIKISSFLTPHDSNMSVGYRIEISDPETHSAARIGYATDIGYVTDAVKDGLFGCESVVIESNHDPEMLLSGRYPYDLKRRILSRTGHLSNKNCAEFSAYLAEHGTKNFMLAHLSAENNMPDIALCEVIGAIADERVQVVAAAPDCITELSTCEEDRVC